VPIKSFKCVQQTRKNSRHNDDRIIHLCRTYGLPVSSAYITIPADIYPIDTHDNIINIHNIIYIRVCRVYTAYLREHTVLLLVCIRSPSHRLKPGDPGRSWVSTRTHAKCRDRSLHGRGVRLCIFFPPPHVIIIRWPSTCQQVFRFIITY